MVRAAVSKTRLTLTGHCVSYSVRGEARRWQSRRAAPCRLRRRWLLQCKAVCLRLTLQLTQKDRCCDALAKRVAARALRVRSSRAVRPPKMPRRAHRFRPAWQARAAC